MLTSEGLTLDSWGTPEVHTNTSDLKSSYSTMNYEGRNAYTKRHEEYNTI